VKREYLGQNQFCLWNGKGELVWLSVYFWRVVERKWKKEWRDGQKGKGQWSQWPK